MFNSKPSRGLAAKADRLAKTAYDRIAEQPAPDHLIQLADDLEAARRAGVLRGPGRAA
jgi:hypothetical protein